MKAMVRVRFAPSPTGYLHIGGLRTALYNELFSLRHGGVFLLRIEDTDRTRYVEGAVENLLRTLAWAGVQPAEGPYIAEDGTIKERGAHGPYVQSARLHIYREHADRLLASGNAYRCFCTPERLEEVKKAQAAAKQPMMYDRHCQTITDANERVADGQSWVLRLRVPQEGSTAFTDAIRGDVSFENKLVDDQVLMKSDGFPTYHLANVVDDHLMDVTHVIRGEEWLPSTPKHVLLYEAFGWVPPVFAHLPLLLNADRSKLSKRQGDVAVEDYRKKGYLPEAITNFVALLGWNPTADREVYAKAELSSAFDLGKINKAGAVMSVEKLDWLNGEYLKAMLAGELMERTEAFFREYGFAGLDALQASGDVFTVQREAMTRAVTLEKSRAKNLVELLDAARALLAPDAYDAGILPGKKGTPETAKARLTALRAFFAGMEDADFEDAKGVEAATIECIKAHAADGWSNGDTLWPLRVALTGREASPSPFEVAWAVGKAETLARIDTALTKLA